MQPVCFVLFILKVVELQFQMTSTLRLLNKDLIDHCKDTNAWSVQFLLRLLLLVLLLLLIY